MTTYTPGSLPAAFVDGDIIDVAYSGAGVQVTVPQGRWKLEVWGAQGGYQSDESCGGRGGYATGIIELAEETILHCYAGGSGNSGGASSSTETGYGGFNGGGLRAYYAGGGGGSDVRVGQDSLYARVIVAGGGGSDGTSTAAGGAAGVAPSTGYGTNKGAGGATFSGTDESTTASEQSDVVNATSSAAYGGFGFGGNGQFRSKYYGGGGGGGWYGGSGTYPMTIYTKVKGGAGGSGYVWTEDTAENYPDGCLLDTSMYLTDAAVSLGSESFTSPAGETETGHAGNGHVRLTLIEVGGFIATFETGRTTSTAKVPLGSAVEFPDAPDHYLLTAWTVDGAVIDPSGYVMSADTTFVSVGEYRYSPGDAVELDADMALYAVWGRLTVGMTPNPVEVGTRFIVTVGVEKE